MANSFGKLAGRNCAVSTILLYNRPSIKTRRSAVFLLCAHWVGRFLKITNLGDEGGFDNINHRQINFRQGGS